MLFRDEILKQENLTFIPCLNYISHADLKSKWPLPRVLGSTQNPTQKINIQKMTHIKLVEMISTYDQKGTFMSPFLPYPVQ